MLQPLSTIIHGNIHEVEYIISKQPCMMLFVVLGKAVAMEIDFIVSYF